MAVLKQNPHCPGPLLGYPEHSNEAVIALHLLGHHSAQTVFSAHACLNIYPTQLLPRCAPRRVRRCWLLKAGGDALCLRRGICWMPWHHMPCAPEKTVPFLGSAKSFHALQTRVILTYVSNRHKFLLVGSCRKQLGVGGKAAVGYEQGHLALEAAEGSKG